MAYEFRADETVQESVLRCAREQLDRALSALGDELQRDPEAAVHSARKAIKKERALLRLVRGSLASELRRQENARLRDAARRLSGVRDADVMVETVDRLAERFTGQLPQSTFAAVRQQLQAAGPGLAAAPTLAERAEEVRQELLDVRSRVDTWQLRSDGWQAIRPGLLRTYRSGRRGLRLMDGDPPPERLHEWRKRVKDLWYQLRLLTPICGPTTRGQAEEADRLAELLGEGHDLVTLRQALLDRAADVGVDLDALIALIDYRRQQVQSQAVHIGTRLYAEKPGAFRRRLRRSWRAGQHEHQAFQERHPAALAQVVRQPHHGD